MSQLPTRRAAWGAALGWSGLCLAVLAGLPAWLVSTWGWPPPTLGLGVRVGGFPAHPGPGAGVGIVDVAVWAAWAGVAWFAFAVGVEAAQAVALKTPRRLVGLGPAQALAARAIGAILLVRALSGAAPAPAPAAPASLVLDHRDAVTPQDPVVVDAATTAEGSNGSQPSTPDRSAVGAPPTEHGPSYVVRRGDTLWGIAATRLGNPMRWPEIATLNYGRTQPDGRALTSAHWIYPGWMLRLPVADGAATAPPRRSDPDSGPREGPPTSAPAAPPGPAAAHHALGPAEPDRKDAASPPPTASTRGSSSSPGAEPRQGPHDTGGHADLRSVAVDTGVVAAILVGLVEVLRRVQQRHRRRGRRIRLPEGHAADTEARLRWAATPETVERIDAALHRLAGIVASSGAAVPTPRVVIVGDQGCELVVEAEAGNPPAGVTGWPGHWVLADLVGVDQARRGDVTGCPWPALVPLGVEDDRLVIANLEAAGTVSLSGPPEVVREVLRAIAAQMAAAPWAAAAEVVLVGFGAELRPALRPRLARSLEDVVAELSTRARQVDQLRGGAGKPSLPEMRLTDGGDAWDPMVVISAEAPGPEATARILEAARPGGPVAVVAPGLTGAYWRLDLSGAEGVLDPLGIRLRPTRLDEEEWRGLGELLAVAGDLEDTAPSEYTDRVPGLEGLTPIGDTEPADLPVRTDEARRSADVPVGAHLAAGQDIAPGANSVLSSPEPGTEGSEDTPEAVPARAGRELDLRDDAAPTSAVDAPVGVALPPEPEVEVLVLGPVRLRGNRVEPERAKHTEVVTRLAMAERTLSTDELITDLWAGSAARSTVDSNISKAREVLGTRPDGTPRLARAQGWGERALHESVRTDWWRFRFLARQGSTGALRMALELIRGRPFEGFKADWPERIYVPNMVTEIVDVAEALARRALKTGDPATARWAARQGLKVAEYDERLWRCLLLSVHDESGVAAMEAVFDECAVVTEATVEPFDSLQPETIELYLRLGGRRRASRRESAPVG